MPMQFVALRFVVRIRNNVTAVEASNPPTTTHSERISTISGQSRMYFDIKLL